MTTRAEKVEACDTASLLADNPPWLDERLRAAAATLTSDGLLRERLKKLVEEWESKAIDLVREGDDAEVGLTLRDCARELAEMLKEEGNG